MAVNLVLIVNFLTWTAVTAARILLSLYALHLGAATSTVGGVIAMMYVFPLLLSWPVGVLSDRVGSSRIMMVGYAIGTMGLVLPFFFQSTAALYLASSAIGCTMALMNVTSQNLIGVLSKPHERAKNFSNLALTGSLCNFVGPILTGFLIDHAGFPVTSLLIMLPVLSCLIAMLAWGHLLPKGSGQRGKGKSSPMQMLADRGIWKMLTISSLAQMTNDTFQTFLPIHAHESGLSASVIGIILAAIAVGSFVVRLGLPRLISTFGHYRLLAGGFYSGALAFALIPFVHNAFALAVLAFVFGLIWGCSQPIIMMTMFEQAAEGRGGEAIGLRLTVNNLMRILSPAIFGSIGAAVGVQAIFWIQSALMGGGGRLSQFRIRKTTAT